MVIECGMTKVYLDGLKGKEVNSGQIFEGCKSGKSFFRIAGGMAWKALWQLIWAMIAVVAFYVGIIPTILSTGAMARVFGGYGYGYGMSAVSFFGSFFLWIVVAIIGLVPAIYKSYEYRFTPYILMTRPEVNATAALRLSKELTKGKKGQMFLATYSCRCIYRCVDRSQRVLGYSVYRCTVCGCQRSGIGCVCAFCSYLYRTLSGCLL